MSAYVFWLVENEYVEFEPIQTRFFASNTLYWPDIAI